jgi:hypothetical protein
MQHTPFMINTGRHSHIGFKPQQAWSKLESVNEFTDQMAKGLEEMKAALTKVKDEYTMYYNHWHEPAPIFAPSDKVWLNGSNITTNWPSSKLSHCWLGPLPSKLASDMEHIILLYYHNFNDSIPSFLWWSCPLPYPTQFQATDLLFLHLWYSSMVKRNMKLKWSLIVEWGTIASNT